MSTSKEIVEKMQDYIESEVGQDIQTIIAYTVRKTKTLKDDEILDNIDDVKDVVSIAIDNIADITPTDKEAKQAIVRLLEAVANLTPTRWDNRAIPIIEMFL
jgi:hypothetical protein